MAAAVTSDASQWEFSCDFEVDYESEENASIFYAALAVDKELQPDKVKRQTTVVKGKLLVHFEAVEARFLPASFSVFADVLTLATKTIEQFGQGMELYDTIAQICYARRIAEKLYPVARMIDLHGGHLMNHGRTEEVNQAVIDLIKASEEKIIPQDWTNLTQTSSGKHAAINILSLPRALARPQ